jgi:hypothetical protein
VPIEGDPFTLGRLAKTKRRERRRLFGKRILENARHAPSPVQRQWYTHLDTLPTSL